MLTNEQKAKILGMYYGCMVQIGNDSCGTISYKSTTIEISIGAMLGIPACKLLLTPLEKIADEHAVEVANVCGASPLISDARKCYIGRQVIGFHFLNMADYSSEFDTAQLRDEVARVSALSLMRVFQYVIQQGYAVPLFIEPNHPDNGKDAITLGLAIDKTLTHATHAPHPQTPQA